MLRIEGRIRRLKLPLPAEPPQDVPPAACFLCHPERDRLDRGAWPKPDGALRLLGNAHPFADATLLLAPSGEACHAATPATLPLPLLAELLSAPSDPAFVAAAELQGLDLAAFMNVGVRAAQSRRHPHLQIVGFRPERQIAAAIDGVAIAADRRAAAAEGRQIELSGVEALVPRNPGMTAELWIVLPDRSADARERVARGVQQASAACERAISGAYNLVLAAAGERSDGLIRLIPRGLSERGGLELAAPAALGAVIGTSVRESLLLWESALRG